MIRLNLYKLVEFVPNGNKFIPFSVGPFQNGIVLQELNRKFVVSFVETAEIK